MPKKAFVFSTGADTAGCSERLAQAMRHSLLGLEEGEYDPQAHWSARAMVSMQNYIQYPVDAPYSLANLLRLYDESDLIQINSTMHGQEWYDRGQAKPTVMMHHGFHQGHFYKDAQGCALDAEALGATQVGSTVNLELLMPLGPPGPHSVTWTPTPYDLGELARLRQRAYRPSSTGAVRVVHAPTDRTVKSTQAFISAMKSLYERGFPVEMVLIERQTHAETMRIKATAGDILVDQLNLGYGCNAIEAWALGMPVIGAVNAHPDWKQHMKHRFGLIESPTGLPFYEADESSLEHAIETLIVSEQARQDWSDIGLAHVRRHHSEPAVSQLMNQIWDAAVKIPTVPSYSTVKLRGLRGLGLVRAKLPTRV